MPLAPLHAVPTPIADRLVQPVLVRPRPFVAKLAHFLHKINCW